MCLAVTLDLKRTEYASSCGITSVAYSPDGTNILSAATDRTIKAFWADHGYLCRDTNPLLERPMMLLESYVPMFVESLREDGGYIADLALVVLFNVTSYSATAAKRAMEAGLVKAAVERLHDGHSWMGCTVGEHAAGVLDHMLRSDCSSSHGDEQSTATERHILAALRERPPLDSAHLPGRLVDVTTHLQTVSMRLVDAALVDSEQGEGYDALQQAVDRAAAVFVPDGLLHSARSKLSAMREARLQRLRELGLDRLKTPDEFLCPITFEVMEDPVVASDGHTYERSAIEDVLALPEERRKSPLTRELLQMAVYPNRALKTRIEKFHYEVEAAAERAARIAAERANAKKVDQEAAQVVSKRPRL